MFRRGIGHILRVLAVAALGVPAVGLILFGPRAASSVPANRTVVVYWEKWTDFEGRAMRDLVAHYNETEGRRAGTYVDYTTTTGIDLKTLIATSGGDPIDLAGLWQRNVVSFAASDASEALDERAARSGITRDMLIPVFDEACRYHGRLYAVPVTPATIALYYNKDILAQFAESLRKSGLDPETAPRTLAELDRFADIVQRRDRSGNLKLMAYLPASPDTIGWFWNSWPIWFGGRLFDPAEGRFRVDTPPFLEAYSWVQAYTARFGRKDVLNFEGSMSNYASPQNPFMIGELAMMRQGPWFANTIRQFAPDIRYGVAPFPTVDGRERAFCEQDVLVIPRGARHADEAWAFIEWLYTAEPIRVQSRYGGTGLGYDYCEIRTATGVERRPMPPLRPIEWICWMHCKNSPLREPSPAFLETHPNPAIEVHDRLARGPEAQIVPPLPNWTELNAEFGAAYRDIWMTDVPARKRLETLQLRLDVLTEQAKRRQARYGQEYP